MPRKPPEPWRLDRSIPLAILVAVLVQLLTTAWYAGAFANRLDVVEKAQAAAAPQAVAIARMDAKLEGLTVSVAEIKDLLRRPPPR